MIESAIVRMEDLCVARFIGGDGIRSDRDGIRIAMEQWIIARSLSRALSILVTHHFYCNLRFITCRESLNSKSLLGNISRIPLRKDTYPFNGQDAARYRGNGSSATGTNSYSAKTLREMDQFKRELEAGNPEGSTAEQT